MQSKKLFSASHSFPVEGFVTSYHSFPGNQALYINGRYYTYAELMDLALFLHSKIDKKKRYSFIGIYCTSDVFSYAAILAVLIYGAAYVPLNPLFPKARNLTIIENCGLEIIISNQLISEYKSKADIVTVSELPDSDLSKPIHIPEAVSDSKYAYVMFTSGSTGNPKGVPISKKNLEVFFDYFLSNYVFQPDDRFLQPYECTFDVSVFSIFMPWYVGACCYVVPSDGIKYLNIIKFLNDHHITVCSLVPTVLVFLEKHAHSLSFPSLRYSFFSGDILYHDLAVKWKSYTPNAELHNFYGPTETTIVCTRYVWNESGSAKESINNVVPLGQPFTGIEFIILNENNVLADKHEIGELCLSGDQVIENYLGNVHKEAFLNYGGKHYYRTGDMVSVNYCGNILFHGRKDSQVKVNGYRVELTEIEAAIQKITNKMCFVKLQKNKNGLGVLVACIEAGSDEDALIKELMLCLPQYMIPKKILAVREWPFNLNGKTDRQELKKLLDGRSAIK